MQKNNLIKKIFGRFNFFYEILVILKEIKRLKENKKSLRNYNRIFTNLKNNKLLSLDIGASGGFNKEEQINKKFNKFFYVFEIEPIKKEYSKIISKNKKNIGFWSENKTLKLYITRDFGATSVFKPYVNNFQFIYNDLKNLKNIEIKKTETINCMSINAFCFENNIKQLDYIKIDTQGSEFEILSGLGKYRPLIIKTEAQTLNCYKNINTFDQIIKLLDNLGYVAISFDRLDYSILKLPIFIDILFIPKFQNYKDSVIINGRREKFISILQIFGLEKFLKLYNL